MKTFRWLVGSILVIASLYFIGLADETATPWPLFFTVVCLGIVYLSADRTAQLSKPLFFLTLAVLAVSGLAARFINVDFLIGPDFPLKHIGFYLSWSGWTFVIGLPAMAVGYKKFS